METRSFLALLAGGFVLLALGGITRDRDVRRAGMEPLGLALKGAGLALLTYAMYRLVKGA